MKGRKMQRYSIAIDETARKKMCAEAFGTEVKIELRVLIKDAESLLERAEKEVVGTLLYSVLGGDDTVHVVTSRCLLGECDHCNEGIPEDDIKKNAIAGWVLDAIVRSITDSLEFLGSSADVQGMKKRRIL